MLNFIIYYTGTGSRKRFWINRRKLCPRACLVAANNSPHQTHFFGDALPVAGSGQNVSPAHPSITVVRSAIQMEGLHLTKKIQRQTWMSHSCKIKPTKTTSHKLWCYYHFTFCPPSIFSSMKRDEFRSHYRALAELRPFPMATGDAAVRDHLLLREPGWWQSNSSSPHIFRN